MFMKQIIDTGYKINTLSAFPAWYKKSNGKKPPKNHHKFWQTLKFPCTNIIVLFPTIYAFEKLRTACTKKMKSK